MRRRRATIVAGCLLFVWAAVSAAVVAFAAEQALSAQHRVMAARRSILAGARDDSITDQLRSAHDRFTRARTITQSPILLPIRSIPGISRQMASFSALSRAGARVTLAVAHAGRNMPRIDSQATAADRRMRLIGTSARIASSLATDLRGIDLGPRTWLLPPLASRRATFAHDLTGLRHAAVVGRVLDPLLRGPRRYLVLAANNAEMRGGSGMFLSAGELTISNGHFDLGQMSSTVDMRVPDARVPLDADMKANWGWLHPNQEWRNVNVTPRFDATARLAADMWKATAHNTVDGVIAVDAVGLAAILRATGPVDVDGRRIDDANVISYVLHDQYVGVDMTDTAKSARRERLGSLAAQALQAVERGGWDPATLLKGLSKAIDGRHLLAWSADATQERMWTSAGMDGRVPVDAFTVGVLNRGGTKLDPFLHVDARLEHNSGDNGTVTIRLRNDTPSGEPPYVEGPHPLSHAAPGEYTGILTLTLPGRVTKASIHGGDRLAVSGRDGTSSVIGTTIDLKRGARRTVVVRFVLPGQASVEIVPSGRVPAVRWHFGRRSWLDGLKNRFRW